ncbi:TetR family transcriptional regulator [Microtetraspora sp. NBRC 13810]|uniref:TetR/AcrR family transcriptional regulator n=1 Tax=Microtetraspora sp. NBRC 13810 TaxID=3030990 RepID=UPI0024A50ADE|nr:TetR/AcrR family transcriptional regulator [Microtetraspora sp. NBRC 13810]GLW11899.1 TetR family transcriptional regulator [Microtetraspora sp. NBRC 13810]
MAQVWMPAPESGRGRPPSYSRAQIAEAAIAIADEHGIDAVSMRKVAAALGTGAMSLYRYVENKQALCQMMLDHIVGEIGLPEPTGDWQADLRAVAERQRATQLAHPWLAGMAAGRPAMGPNVLRMLEHSMAVLDGLGLSLEDMLETYSLVSSWVNGFVQEELTERDIRRGTGLDEQGWQRSLAPHLETLTANGEYPYFTRILREGADHDFDTRFTRGLTRILTGIAATLPPTP